MPNPLFEVSELWAGYGEQQVLRGVDLQLFEGSITALIGANGAGKTTFLRTVSGLIKAQRGRIRLGGRDLIARSTHEIVALGFAHSPEGKQLFPEMSVLENLLVGATTARARAQRDQSLREVFELFPVLADRRAQLAGTLSGGQQQMVAVGRALMALPRVLALDEPSLGLAPIMVQRLFDTIARIRTRGVAILVIEQNVQMVLKLADQGFVLENGQIAMSGSGSALLGDPRLRSAYLGL